MLTQFFPRLSKNYIEILKDNEYYDIKIEVGKDPNVKIFRAHMVILCYRSLFLRRTLDSNKKDNNILSYRYIKLPNISPEIFQIILDYIYGGIISLNEQDISEILKVLVAADQLHLQELVEYLQAYLIDKKTEWIEQHFEQAYRASFQSNSLLKLLQFCTDYMAKSPEKIFKSFDFTSLPERTLISLIKRDDLQMKEIEVWEHVLKWGIAQNPTLVQDLVNWSDNDFKILENTLRRCLPLIRFFSLSSEEFIQKIYPYNKLLKPQLYEDLFRSYLDPNSEPSNNILLPRSRSIDGIIDSKIVNLNIVSIISRWVDKIDVKSKFAYIREFHLPYKFKLLLRGSRDGLTPNKFHTLCNNIPHTVTFIKVKETEEIIGGYNPLVWKNSLLITDYEAMANKIMPELGKEIEEFKYSTWHITNWLDLKEEKITGPEFEAGGRKWRISLYPFGNQVRGVRDHISIYLETDLKDTHSCVQLALVLWNPESPTQFIFNHSKHRFTAKDNWGFARFYELNKLFTPSENRTRALIENNSTNITAFVRVLKDPTGDLWLNNDSMKKVLKNHSNSAYDMGKTKDSFIFSFKNKNNFKDPILSHVKNIDEALFYCNEFGPAFSCDLFLGAKENDDLREYHIGRCIQRSYEKKIQDAEDKFLIEDYEVFQIIKNED